MTACRIALKYLRIALKDQWNIQVYKYWDCRLIINHQRLLLGWKTHFDQALIMASKTSCCTVDLIFCQLVLPKQKWIQKYPVFHMFTQKTVWLCGRFGHRAALEVPFLGWCWWREGNWKNIRRNQNGGYTVLTLYYIYYIYIYGQYTL